MQCREGHSCSLGKLKEMLEDKFEVDRRGWKGMIKINSKQSE